jgi:MFS family permease
LEKEESIMISWPFNRSWRFWPVLCLSFIFAFSNPLLMIATPIYFFQQGVQIKFISLLSISMTITYSISPIVLNKLSDKLGRRKSVILSLIGASCAQLTFYITLNPILFLIERLFEGFILGFFFPNLQASISDNPSLDHQKYLARFNLSWSFAIVLGFLFGAILLQFNEDLRFLFYINPLFFILNAIIAIIFLREPLKTNQDDTNRTIDFDTGNPESHQILPNIYKTHIPVIIPLLLVLATAFASGNGALLYPIRAELLGFSPSSTYIVQIFSTIAQSISMYFASQLALNKSRLISAITMATYSFLFIFLYLNNSYFLFIILFILSGLFYGILYGIASKLFITLNVLKKTSIYSSISEASLGITYFLSQITIGFIADISIGLGYLAITLSMILIFFIIIVFLRKLKEI